MRKPALSHGRPRGSERTVAVVTGSRAELGLLRPVMDAVIAHPTLRLRVIAAGSHFLPPARTINELSAAYPVFAGVRMQRPNGARTRHADALAVARGVAGFARVFERLRPDWVVVLGDRIEAFAAAAAASIAGFAVCHIHGGDRAEGIADEAMRHAITKLAHLHCAASAASAKRLLAMGEPALRVHRTGSPAIDGLAELKPLTQREFRAMGSPRAVVLMHPSGDAFADEEFMRHTFVALEERSVGPVLLLAPNADAGSTPIWAALSTAIRERNAAGRYLLRPHVPRSWLLRWMLTDRRRHFLIGNSSAGLIECAAMGCRAINLGQRQAGRERAGNVIDVPAPDARAVSAAVASVLAARREPARSHPYGNGRAGERIAALLAETDPHDPALLRKRNAY